MARFIPSNSNAIKSKISPAVVYLFGKSCALGYYGKAENASFNYRFKSADARAKYVADWFKSMDARAADKAARQAAKKAQGWCLACGSEQDGCEPDARKYKCEGCGKDKVYGAAELAVMGLVA